MLLALIANFATYAASAPYKYPIAFSHNERNAIRRSRAPTSIQYRIVLGRQQLVGVVTLIVSRTAFLSATRSIASRSRCTLKSELFLGRSQSLRDSLSREETRIDRSTNKSSEH